MRHLLLGALVALSIYTPVLADTDCGGKLNFAETLLCADPALLALEKELTAIHEKARRAPTNPVLRALLKRHEGWARIKNSCITSLCVRMIHEERIQDFRKALE